MTNSGRSLDFSFDVDLGELMPGHHVVLRGIERGRLWPTTEKRPIPVDEVDHVHFEHVPGLTKTSSTPDWGFQASDDVGTQYTQDEGGAFDGHSGGISTHGFRDLGRIPPEASLLTLKIHPANEWEPPEPWCRELVIDLRRKVVVD
jgi:hypothetical protein